MAPDTAAATLLEPYKIKDYFQLQARRLTVLPPSLYNIALPLIGGFRKSENLTQAELNKRQAKAIDALADLPAADRMKLFSAISPEISFELEAAWQVFDYLPYTNGYNRRPFRIIPGSSSQTNSLRSHWFFALLKVIDGFDQPVTWFAERAAYLGWNAPKLLGTLFAGAINNGGPIGREVFDILCASARGDHPIGRMGRHVVRGLLASNRPEAWAYIEKMLLSAQREEGLRQSILEAIDESHPQAFLRMLNVLRENNLIRFSSTVRAVSVWLGMPFEAANPKVLQETLAKLTNLLEHRELAELTLTDGSPEEQYLALWSIAFHNTDLVVEKSKQLIQHTDPKQRFIAAFFLYQVTLPVCRPLLLPMINDPDLCVSLTALQAVEMIPSPNSAWKDQENYFEMVENLIARLPKNGSTVKQPVWEWNVTSYDRKYLTDILYKCLGNRPPSRLLPYLKDMSVHVKTQTAQLFLLQYSKDPRYREALFTLAADRDSTVHEKALEYIAGIHPTADEITSLEASLTRKKDSYRRGVIHVLLNQTDQAVMASIRRLTQSKDQQQRLAGLSLLREMIQVGRNSRECQGLLKQLKSTEVSDSEQNTLTDLLPREVKVYSLDDALGLVDLKKRSTPLEPKSKVIKSFFGFKKEGIRLGSPAAQECLLSLDELIQRHSTDEVDVIDWNNQTRKDILADAGHRLAKPDPALSFDENLKRFPLAEIFEDWWKNRPKSMRDADGFELLRAAAALGLISYKYVYGKHVAQISNDCRTFLDEPYKFSLNYQGQVDQILTWLIFLHPADGELPFLLDAMEETFLRIKNKHIGLLQRQRDFRWPLSSNYTSYLDLARDHQRNHLQLWSKEDHSRFWRLLLWLEKQTWEDGGRFTIGVHEVIHAYQAGAASREDFICFLLIKKIDNRYSKQYIFHYNNYSELKGLSSKTHKNNPDFSPAIMEIISDIRERILEIELHRGDLPTAATPPALALSSIPGIDYLVKILTSLGKLDIVRVGYSASQDRTEVLSHFIRVSHPTEGETSEMFSTAIRKAGIPEKKLVQLAVYAPQWASFVEHSLGWDGFAEGVWWLYAHTKDRQWTVEKDIREEWTARISMNTPLSADELLDGAVDVSWFQRLYSRLGDKRWNEIYQLARLASTGTGHSRAKLFSTAILGQQTSEELTERIKAKRNQDAVRSLGLLPLPEGPQREQEILARYKTLQEFLRTSKQFGSQRQASEKLAARIGMDNLARTAGFVDPLRLEWAMELADVKDLASGSITVRVEDVSATLRIDDLGEVEVTFTRGDKPLKSLPAAFKKNEVFTLLQARKQELLKQARRMRSSLENAMVRGDTFTAAEIQTLFAHPILRVMLESLMFISPKGMGYPADQGRSLEGLGGAILPLQPEDSLRIAHPHDLLLTGRWHDWQHDCFITERIQPFKQVFRELYPLTQTEKDELDVSRRYAGHQVNPRQALALLGGRGWVAAHEEGVFKTFHEERIVARIGFLQDVTTPGEVEGLTIEAVVFTPRNEYKGIALDQVPPRLFSEVMRDLDLVVSVAHAGGVDPESSASSIEARTSLIRETVKLLNLTNVQITNHHAMVTGKLGQYSVHLGSAVVHKQPGGALCIVPVHSQHRGRLFLPFVDNDPKSAEVVSKVILLAKDQEIKDPTILEQILNR